MTVLCNHHSLWLKRDILSRKKMILENTNWGILKKNWRKFSQNYKDNSYYNIYKVGMKVNSFSAIYQKFNNKFYDWNIISFIP